jgi:hypothetical protein
MHAKLELHGGKKVDCLFAQKAELHTTPTLIVLTLDALPCRRRRRRRRRDWWMLAHAHLPFTQAGCFGGSRSTSYKSHHHAFCTRRSNTTTARRSSRAAAAAAAMPEDAAPAAAATATLLLRMVAVDMDGTLLRPDSTISDRTVAVLRAIHAQGTIVCVASGRPAPTIRKYARQLDIGPLPTVCFNGACAMLLDGDAGGGGGGAGTDTDTSKEVGTVQESDFEKSKVVGGGDEVWFAQNLDLGVVSAVLALAAELDLPVQYCLPDRSLTSPKGTKQTQLVAFFDALVGPEGWSVKVPTLAPTSPSPPSAAAATAADGDAETTASAAATWPGPLPPPLKLIVITGSQSRADEVAAHARLVLPPDVCHIIAAEVHVEFLMPGVDKASGLAHVCRALGVALDEVGAVHLLSS